MIKYYKCRTPDAANNLIEGRIYEGEMDYFSEKAFIFLDGTDGVRGNYDSTRFKEVTAKEYFLQDKSNGVTVPFTDTWKPEPVLDGQITEHFKPIETFTGDRKDTNPKDAVGTKKVPFSTIPMPVIAEIGIGMLEGARKYGRHNYRISAVRSSVYFDATYRHIMSWWEGEDIDPDSGLSHVTKAITSLVVLRDAMIQSKLVDDRPPASPEGWLRNLQPHVDAIFERHPTAVPAYTKDSK